MGFVAGFAGGVTLTLSLTYIALLTHTSNRQAQSAVLRSQASTVDALVPPDPSLPPSARRRNATVLLPDGTYRPRESLERYRLRDKAGAEPGAAAPSSFLETAKTKWNSEVLAAVHWAQNKDWGKVRADAEEGVARLLGVELSREPVKVVEEEVVYPYSVPPPPPPPAPTAGAVNREAAAVVHKVSDALYHAREKGVVIAHAMEEEAKEIVTEAREVVAEGVEEAKRVVGKGVERAHDLVERTKAAVHLAEERAEARADAKLLHTSDIEKALAERYDSARREARMKRSVQDVLKERYIPMDQRDNSELRLV